MRRLKIALASMLILAGLLCGIGYATTVLTDGTTWCTGVKSPDPGDPVRASAGTVGTIRDGLQCLANRTKAIVLGNVTLKQIEVDGTGAQTPMNVFDGPGKIVSSSSIISTGGNLVGQGLGLYLGTSVAGGTPNSSVTESFMPLDNVPFARGYVSGSCGCTRCVNVFSMNLAAAGHCQITLNNAPAYAIDTAHFFPTVEVTSLGGGSPPHNWALDVQGSISGGKVVLDVWQYDLTSAALTSTAFSFIMWP